MRKRTRYVLDTSAFIAFFLNEKEAEDVEKILLDSIKRDNSCIMSVVQYGELLYTILNRESKRDHRWLSHLMEMYNISLVEADKSSAEVAASYKARGGISYSNCLVIALAKEKNATIVTKDKEFKKFEKDVSIKWIG